MTELDTDYKEIPMSDITDEARELAVRWGENMKDDFIAQKHKLASDIMNYAHRYGIKIAEMQRQACAEEANKEHFTPTPLLVKTIKETPLVITRNTIPNV